MCGVRGPPSTPCVSVPRCEAAVAVVVCCRLQLRCPGQYSPLEAFYEDKKAVLPPLANGQVTSCPTWSVTNISRCMHPEMKVRGGPHSDGTALNLFLTHSSLRYVLDNGEIVLHQACRNININVIIYFDSNIMKIGWPLVGLFQLMNE